MNARLKYLKKRRELLVSRAAVQRSKVSHIATNLQQRLWFVDMGIGVVQGLRNQPSLAAASASFLLPASKHKWLIWGGRLFTAWELYTLVREQRRATK